MLRLYNYWWFWVWFNSWWEIKSNKSSWTDWLVTTNRPITGILIGHGVRSLEHVTMCHVYRLLLGSGGEVPNIPTCMFRDFELFPLWFLGVRPLYHSQNFRTLRMLEEQNFPASTAYLFWGAVFLFWLVLTHHVTSHSAKILTRKTGVSFPVGFCDNRLAWRPLEMAGLKMEEAKQSCSWNSYGRCYSLGIQSTCQRMIGVYNHLLRKVFRFHYHSQFRWLDRDRYMKLWFFFFFEFRVGDFTWCITVSTRMFSSTLICATWEASYHSLLIKLGSPI